jgi:putative FmdB family regulatory protein
MAIYEYTCVHCIKDFEVMKPMSEASKKTCCPSCGKPAERMVSVFASKAEYAIKVPAKAAFRGESKAKKAAPGVSAKAAPKKGARKAK